MSKILCPKAESDRVLFIYRTEGRQEWRFTE